MFRLPKFSFSSSVSLLVAMMVKINLCNNSLLELKDKLRFYFLSSFETIQISEQKEKN